MKKAVMLLGLCLVLLGRAEVDITKALPALALPDGQVLENVTLSNFRTETVLLKHRRGMNVVRYELLPQEVRIEAEKRRPGGPRMLPGEMTGAGQGQQIAGQVFITTRGTGSYKFSDVDVYAFAASARTIWESRSNPVRLPKPLAQAKTDADGRFEMRLPKGTPFILFAQAYRQVPAGSQLATESFEWRAPSAEMKDLSQINLAANWRENPRPVVISEY